MIDCGSSISAIFRTRTSSTIYEVGMGKLEQWLPLKKYGYLG